MDNLMPIDQTDCLGGPKGEPRKRCLKCGIHFNVFIGTAQMFGFFVEHCPESEDGLHHFPPNVQEEVKND